MIRNILKTEVEIVTEDENKTANEGEDHEVTPDVEIRSEAEQQKFESDFAIKMVDTLVSFNDQQISLHELPYKFRRNTKCFADI